MHQYKGATVRNEGEVEAKLGKTTTQVDEIMLVEFIYSMLMYVDFSKAEEVPR